VLADASPDAAPEATDVLAGQLIGLGGAPERAGEASPVRSELMRSTSASTRPAASVVVQNTSNWAVSAVSMVMGRERNAAK